VTTKLSWKEFRPSIPTIIQSSFIGVFRCRFPGIGPSAAEFFPIVEAKEVRQEVRIFGPW